MHNYIVLILSLLEKVYQNICHFSYFICEGVFYSFIHFGAVDASDLRGDNSNLSGGVGYQLFAVDASDLRGDNSFVLSVCCLLYTSPSPRDQRGSRMPSSA